MSVLRLLDYRLLLIGNAMTFAGFQVRQMAQAWLVLEQTESSSYSALYAGVVNAMPGFAIIGLSLYAGTVSDRKERWRIIIVSRFVIVSMMIVSALLVSLDVILWWHLIPVGLVMGAAFAFHNPASQTYAMDIVGREKLLSAASLNTAISNVANIAAPALGGYLISLGLEWAFWLLVVLYGTSFLAIIPSSTRGVPAAVSRSIVADMRAGLSYVARTPAIRWLLIVGMGSLFSGIALAMIPLFARSIFDVGSTGYGQLLLAQGTGSLIGSIALTATGGIRRKGLLIIASSVVSAGGLALCAVSPWYWMALASLFVTGLSSGVMFILVPTTIQTHAAPEMRGRVMGIFFMVVLIFQLGWIVGGALDSVIGTRPTMLMAAIGTATTPMLALWRSAALRRLT
ncbi:MAG: MFS transporter [Chloroflexi bacterium]|nr:MFS transporter [Chloroflexota bacterium]